MTEVLQSPSHFQPSPSSSSTPNDGSHPHALFNTSTLEDHLGTEEEEKKKKKKKKDLDTSTATATATAGSGKLSSMEIGWPSNVRHVAHVTFDRFHGFLGLPVEFEPEVPRRAPSARQKEYSELMLENSQEEYVRDQLNRGIVPDGIDVHCLAGLIKAWFRELPAGILDSLSPEQVMQSQSEEECTQLVQLLPPTEAALLDWAINLMADVAQLEHLNKMNARNVAMVFAPNMTQVLFLAQEPSDEDGHQSSSQPCLEEAKEEDKEHKNFLTSIENVVPGSLVDNCPCEVVSQVNSLATRLPDSGAVTDASRVVQRNTSKRRTGLSKSRTGQSSVSKKGSKNVNESLISRAAGLGDKAKGPGIVGRINSRTELVEAWR
uniref:Rho-GAP domain-containing protein n=1 Tax=Fagus sylvatica TaxID=28930 RepID=A0A2N9J976_FAGSY